MRHVAGQVSNELDEYFHVEGLEEVRVIRDRQTSKWWIYFYFVGTRF